MATTTEFVFLRAGDFYFGSGRVRIKTLLGTCVAISMWHPQSRIGGMCHFLLPTRRAAQSNVHTAAGFYADEVMPLFIDALARHGTHPSDYQVKVCGGGNMFPGRVALACGKGQRCNEAQRTSCPQVGCHNVVSAHRLLAAGGFRIASEDVGGHGSRNVVFDLDDGNLWVCRGAAMNMTAADAAAGTR